MEFTSLQKVFISYSLLSLKRKGGASFKFNKEKYEKVISMVVMYAFFFNASNFFVDFNRIDILFLYKICIN